MLQRKRKEQKGHGWSPFSLVWLGHLRTATRETLMEKGAESGCAADTTSWLEAMFCQVVFFVNQDSTPTWIIACLKVQPLKSNWKQIWSNLTGLETNLTWQRGQRYSRIQQFIYEQTSWEKEIGEFFKTKVSLDNISVTPISALCWQLQKYLH